MWTVTLLFRDHWNRETSKRYELNVTLLADAIDAVSGVGGLLTSLNAVTNLQYVEASFQQKDATGAFAGSADTLNNRDIGATFTVMCANGKKAAVKIPGFIGTLANDDGSIDVSGSEVAAFFAHFITGDFKVSDGQAITTVLKGSMDK
jgi:hypothetical protein